MWDLCVWGMMAVVGAGLEPNEVLVIANRDLADSVRLADYYVRKRNIPAENVLALSLGRRLTDRISRDDYDRTLAGPVRNHLQYRIRPVPVRCLVTTYGVPFFAGPRGRLQGKDRQCADLKAQADREQQDLTQSGQKDSAALSSLRQALDCIEGKDTHASVDSELTLVLASAYELYRWQPNALRSGADAQTLMVSRLDGPSLEIARGLVDRALRGEKGGLRGTAYIDSRGITAATAYGQYDRSLRDLVAWLEIDGRLPVKQEHTGALFQPGECPNAALYCGWYSLGKYVDAFDFVEGAVGFHIASSEAVHLRDPNSTQWCPALLRHGITATLGPVSEPYLQAFPEPAAFFKELMAGRCLAEAFFRTNPFNSWQLVLIGDPLYRPFGPTRP